MNNKKIETLPLTRFQPNQLLIRYPLESFPHKFFSHYEKVTADSICKVNSIQSPIAKTHLPGDGHAVEDVPEQDADDDVVPEVEYHALPVLLAGHGGVGRGRVGEALRSLGTRVKDGYGVISWMQSAISANELYTEEIFCNI